MINYTIKRFRVKFLYLDIFYVERKFVEWFSRHDIFKKKQTQINIVQFELKTLNIHFICKYRGKIILLFYRERIL